MTRMKHLFAAFSIFASVGVTSFAATNLPTEERSSWQEVEREEGDGYCAGSDPIWINFFSGGFSGGTFSGESGGLGSGEASVCVKCNVYDQTCEAVYGGFAWHSCRFDRETGMCHGVSACVSRTR